MSDDLKGLIFTFALGFVAIAVLSIIAYCYESRKCDQQWQNSGMRSEYNLFSGCMLENRPGVWIPSQNYRDAVIVKEVKNETR